MSSSGTTAPVWLKPCSLVFYWCTHRRMRQSTILSVGWNRLPCFGMTLSSARTLKPPDWISRWYRPHKRNDVARRRQVSALTILLIMLAGALRSGAQEPRGERDIQRNVAASASMCTVTLGHDSAASLRSGNHNAFGVVVYA